MKPTIREGNENDYEPVNQMNIKAFRDDPFMKHYYWKYAKNQDQAMDMFFQATMEIILCKSDSIFTLTDDYSGAALWYAPGKHDISIFKLLVLMPRIIKGIGWKGLGSLNRVLSVMEKNQPKKEFYHLQSIGVDPAMRRKGIGSALLAPTLERCDKEGVGAYLENSCEENLAFYRKNGFEVIETLQIDPGAPALYAMWREPVGN